METNITDQLQSGSILCSKAVINKINLSKFQLKEQYVSQVQMKNRSKNLKQQTDQTPATSCDIFGNEQEMMKPNDNDPSPERGQKIDSLLAWQQHVSGKSSPPNDLTDHLKSGMDDALGAAKYSPTNLYQDGRTESATGQSFNFQHQSPR